MLGPESARDSLSCFSGENLFAVVGEEEATEASALEEEEEVREGDDEEEGMAEAVEPKEVEVEGAEVEEDDRGEAGVAVGFTGAILPGPADSR